MIAQLSTEYIAIDPDYCFGQPRIADTRMSVAAIAEMYLHMGQPLEEIARKYDLSLASVHAAMAYYYDHRLAIDHHAAETDSIIEQMRHNNPSSKFQQQWRKLKGE